MIINDRILAAIVTLAEELHFGCAAAKLHVSQPALSGTIKSFERDLGVRLFTRNSRHVALTEAGRILVAEARKLTADAERIVELVRRSSEIQGPLRVGYPASINLRWLTALIAEARRGGEFVKDVEFVSVEAADLHQQLLRGALHAGFFSGSPPDSDLVCLPLFQEPFTVVLGARHPLARKTVISLKDLNDEPVVWLRRDLNPGLYSILLDCCSRRAYRPNIVQEVRTFLECAQFAREGLGITFLPVSLRPSWGASVVFADLPQSIMAVDSTLAYRRDRQSKRIQRLVRFVQSHRFQPD